jgi:CMP-N,N'-diacetyllegionaminic acid synthase
MIDNKKILGIIPARSGSKGLKKKNLINLDGYPLIYWPIKAFQESKYIDEFVLSTNSKKIAKVANEFNCKTPFLRPEKISKDNSSSISTVIHAINFYKKKNFVFDYIVLLEPTSPLTDCKDVDKAIKRLHNNRKNSESIVGISKNISFHPDFNVKLNKNGLINFKNSLTHKRRQKLSELYFFDGSLYISKVDVILKKKTFYHKKTLGYVTPKWKSLEIDDMTDYICVNALKKREQKL